MKNQSDLINYLYTKQQRREKKYLQQKKTSMYKNDWLWSFDLDQAIKREKINCHSDCWQRILTYKNS